MIKSATIRADQVSFTISETENGKLKFTMHNEDNSLSISEEFPFKDFEDVFLEVRYQFKAHLYVEGNPFEN